MRSADISYRRATPADAPQAFRVFRLALNEFNERTGQPTIPDEDDQSPSYRHMMRFDPGGFWLAEQHSKPLGFAAAVVRGDWWFLGSLFVLPKAQGRGLGRELLERALATRPDGGPAAAITDSLQPLSNTLYARRGMLPWLPLILFNGRPSLGWPSPEMAGLEPEPILEVTPAVLDDLREVDATVVGLDRSVDHRFHLEEGGRRGWIFRLAGRPVAYAMYKRTGWVGPLACAREADIEPVLLHALGMLAAERPRIVSSGVPSLNVVCQRVFLRLGFVYQAPPALLLATGPFGDLSRYLPASFGLF